MDRSPTPLDVCKARIERAEHHRDVMFEAWARMVELDLYVQHVEVGDDGLGRLAAYPAFKMPDQFALELGEFLYNLRAALDGLIYAAAMLDSGQVPPPGERSLEFPFRSSPKQFDKARSKIAPLRPERQDLIANCQIYRPSADSETDAMRVALAALNDLARIDRHRRLHVVASVAHIDDDIAITVPPPANVNHVQAQPFVTLEEDSEVATFAVDGWVPGMDIHVDARLVVELGIDEPSSATRQSLSDLTGEMLNAVLTVLNVVGISFGFCDPEDRLEGHRPPRLVGPWSAHTGVAAD